MGVFFSCVVIVFFEINEFFVFKFIIEKVCVDFFVLCFCIISYLGKILFFNVVYFEGYWVGMKEEFKYLIKFGLIIF